MKRLMIMGFAAFAIAAAPIGIQPQANEAHHVSKTAKGKKTQGAKPKQSKKPPAKVEKSSQRQPPPRVERVSG